MNDLLNQLALEADYNLPQFAQLIVEHILAKMDDEIGLAHEQDQTWTAATLEALALEILDDFDMELPEDESSNMGSNTR